MNLLFRPELSVQVDLSTTKNSDQESPLEIGFVQELRILISNTFCLKISGFPDCTEMLDWQTDQLMHGNRTGS